MSEREVAKKPSELSVGALKEALTAVAIDFSRIFDKADLIQLLETHLAQQQDDTIQRFLLLELSPYIWRYAVEAFSSSSVVGWNGAGWGGCTVSIEPRWEDTSSSMNLGPQHRERSREFGFRVWGSWFRV